MNLTYKVETASREEIRLHLEACDRSFAPLLSSRVDLFDYSSKIFEKAVSFEAWEDNALVGMINAYLNDTGSRTGFITNVSVLKEYMGRGVASILLNTCLEHAARLGFSKIQLEVSRNNGPAIKLYSRAGFKAVKETGEYFLMERQIGGQWVQGPS